jgi:TonB family protein
MDLVASLQIDGHRPGRRTWIALIILMSTAAGASPQTVDLERALAYPLRPAALAFLTEHMKDQRSRKRIVDALQDSRPEVRAASARVIHASGAADLVPSLSAVLSVESVPDAAIEMIRALASLGDVSTDSVLLEATRRLGLGAIAGPAFAAARGEAALVHMESLRSSGPAFPLEAFLRLATRGQPNSLGPQTAEAFRNGDEEFWKAYLELARQTDSEVPADELRFALTAENFRREALWHLLLVGAQDPDVAATVKKLVASRGEVSEVDDAFLLELLAREQGESPKKNESWIAQRSGDVETILSRIRFRDRRVLPLLTKEERRELSSQVWHHPKLLDEWSEEARLGENAPTSASETKLDFRTVSNFPPGFVQDLLEVTNCAPKSLTGTEAARMLFSPAGRPVRTAFEPGSSASPGCAEASKALILNTILASHELNGTAVWYRVLVPHEPEFLGCLSSSELAAPISGLHFLRGNIGPPRKVKDQPPVYPDSAKKQRIQGLVVLEAIISPSGCVESIRSIRSPDDLLTIASILAVSRWRYEPTLINDKPVPIPMELTVNFSLN